MPTLYTIGFMGSSAQDFFTRLKAAGVKKVVDVRLYPSTQLSGFARKKDLAFFLKALCGIGYQHSPDLAPGEKILRDYKDGKISWAAYEEAYTRGLKDHQIGVNLTPALLDGVCFLCAEPTPEKCHRRLLAEYLAKIHQGFVIRHL